MKIIIDMPDIPAGSTQAKIILGWIQELMADKSTGNVSPLRYARDIKFEE
jgi:hypothetical protein